MSRQKRASEQRDPKPPSKRQKPEMTPQGKAKANPKAAAGGSTPKTKAKAKANK